MFRCVTEISFQQKAKNGDGRNLSFTFDFVKEFSAEDSWTSLTNKCKIIFPKNIYVRDKQGNLFPIGGTQDNKRLNNLFQRGDAMEVKYGYQYYGANGKEVKEITSVFKGYISQVNSKIPIELECEDNMWLLKQIPCRPQVWSKEKTVEDLMKSLLSGTNFTVNALTKTTVGALVIQNESVAQLIIRLRKEFALEAYFFGDELRIGSVVYIDSEAVTHNFVFQQNIIEDNLTYQRKDDVKLSVVCESINTKEGAENKKGKKKTTQERLTVLVFYDADGVAQKTVKQKGKDLPANDEGERRKLFFPNVSNANTLAQFGIDELNKYYYTGFKGKFTTFALPYVKLGDTVKLTDKVLPDRDGSYRVKSVEYTGGTSGHRQIIELHYKLAG